MPNPTNPWTVVSEAPVPPPSVSPDAAIDQFSSQYGVDADLIRAQMHQESGYNANAVSRKGATGYMQLMPDTARVLGVDPTNPLDNIRGGVAHMKSLLKEFNGSVPHALAAYDAGASVVKDFRDGTNNSGKNPYKRVTPDGLPPFDETKNYVNSILSKYQQVKASTPPKEPAPPDWQVASEMKGVVMHDPSEGKNYLVPSTEKGAYYKKGYKLGPYEQSEKYRLGQYGLEPKIAPDMKVPYTADQINKANDNRSTMRKIAGLPPTDDNLKSAGIDVDAYHEYDQALQHDVKQDVKEHLHLLIGKPTPEHPGGGPVGGIRSGIANTVGMVVTHDKEGFHGGQIYHAFSDEPHSAEEAKNLAQTLVYPDGHTEQVPSGPVYRGLHRLFVDPNTADLEKSKEAAKAGHHTQATAYGITGMVPILGPLASHIGEAIGDDPSAGITEGLTYMVGPKVAKEGLKIGLREVAAAAKAPIGAIGRLEPAATEINAFAAKKGLPLTVGQALQREGGPVDQGVVGPAVRAAERFQRRVPGVASIYEQSDVAANKAAIESIQKTADTIGPETLQSQAMPGRVGVADETSPSARFLKDPEGFTTSQIIQELKRSNVELTDEEIKSEIDQMRKDGRFTTQLNNNLDTLNRTWRGTATDVIGEDRINSLFEEPMRQPAVALLKTLVPDFPDAAAAAAALAAGKPWPVALAELAAPAAERFIAKLSEEYPEKFDNPLVHGVRKDLSIAIRAVGAGKAVSSVGEKLYNSTIKNIHDAVTGQVKNVATRAGQAGISTGELAKSGVFRLAANGIADAIAAAKKSFKVEKMRRAADEAQAAANNMRAPEEVKAEVDKQWESREAAQQAMFARAQHVDAAIDAFNDADKAYQAAKSKLAPGVGLAADSPEATNLAAAWKEVADGAGAFNKDSETFKQAEVPSDVKQSMADEAQAPTLQGEVIRPGTPEDLALNKKDELQQVLEEGLQAVRKLEVAQKAAALTGKSFSGDAATLLSADKWSALSRTEQVALLARMGLFTAPMILNPARILALLKRGGTYLSAAGQVAVSTAINRLFEHAKGLRDFREVTAADFKDFVSQIPQQVVHILRGDIANRFIDANIPKAVTNVGVGTTGAGAVMAVTADSFNKARAGVVLGAGSILVDPTNPYNWDGGIHFLAHYLIQKYNMTASAAWEVANRTADEYRDLHKKADYAAQVDRSNIVTEITPQMRISLQAEGFSPEEINKMHPSVADDYLQAKKASGKAPIDVDEHGNPISQSTQPEKPPAAQVPMMITNRMRTQLLDKGFTHGEIDKMTPSEAWGHIIETAIVPYDIAEATRNLRRTTSAAPDSITEPSGKTYSVSDVPGNTPEEMAAANDRAIRAKLAYEDAVNGTRTKKLYEEVTDKQENSRQRDSLRESWNKFKQEVGNPADSQTGQRAKAAWAELRDKMAARAAYIANHMDTPEWSYSDDPATRPDAISAIADSIGRAVRSSRIWEFFRKSPAAKAITLDEVEQINRNRKVFDPEVRDAYTKELADMGFNNAQIKQILPERVWGEVDPKIGGKGVYPSDPDFVEKIKTVINDGTPAGEANMKYVARGVITDILDRVRSSHNGWLDNKAFRREWNSVSAQTKKALFSPDQIKEIDNFAKYLEVRNIRDFSWLEQMAGKAREGVGKLLNKDYGTGPVANVAAKGKYAFYKYLESKNVGKSKAIRSPIGKTVVSTTAALGILRRLSPSHLLGPTSLTDAVLPVLKETLFFKMNRGLARVLTTRGGINDLTKAIADVRQRPALMRALSAAEKMDNKDRQKPTSVPMIESLKKVGLQDEGDYLKGFSPEEVQKYGDRLGVKSVGGGVDDEEEPPKQPNAENGEKNGYSLDDIVRETHKILDKSGVPEAKATPNVTFKNVPYPESDNIHHIEATTEDGKPAGWMEVLRNGEVAQIQGSLIYPEYQGAGIGKAIYKEAARQVAEKGAKSLLSGGSVSPQANAVWKSLQREYPDAITQEGNRYRWDLSSLNAPETPESGGFMSNVYGMVEKALTENKPLTEDQKGFMKSVFGLTDKDLAGMNEEQGRQLIKQRTEESIQEFQKQEEATKSGKATAMDKVLSPVQKSVSLYNALYDKATMLNDVIATAEAAGATWRLKYAQWVQEGIFKKMDATAIKIVDSVREAGPKFDQVTDKPAITDLKRLVQDARDILRYYPATKQMYEATNILDRIEERSKEK